MKIVIPSYKRPDSVLTRQLLPDAYVCIAEREYVAYKATTPSDKLIVMPDPVQGNIARVRNWILDNVDDSEVVMIDDDIRYIGRVEKRRKRRLTTNEIMDLYEQGFMMAEDIGAYLWGVNVNSDKMLYCEYTPLSTQAPVLATMCCIRKNPLRYDERIPLKEDYDYFLQHLRKYRKVLRFNMYHYHPEHITNEGGCVTYRTGDRERECAERLLNKWGSKIVRVDFERSINPIVKSPLLGV